MTDINNRQDIMDSRDVIARIEELQDEQDSLVEEYNDAKEEADDAAEESGDEWQATERLCNAINALASFWDINPEEVDSAVDALDNASDSFNGEEELVTLKAFASGLENYGDWDHGETLIRASYFTEYAEQLADDIGAIDRDAKWPLDHIDWEAAAEALKIDYTESEFDGVTYYMRA